MAIWVNGRWVDAPVNDSEIIRPPMGAGVNSSGTGPPKGLTPNPYAFTPFKPPPIPSGYYDPSLDANQQSAQRGYTNLQQDVGLAGRRATEDYGLDVGDVNRGYGRGVEDLTTGRDRGLEDISRDRRYTNEDYTRNVTALTRQYGQLGRQQGEQARKYGVTSGGIALLSAAKRAENQGLEQKDLDTGLTRATEGFDMAGRRIGEDFTRGFGRLGEDKDASLGRLQTGYDRGVADRGTVLSRAGEENTFFGLDTDAQKNFQATQAGYEAPQRPSNEFVRPDGSVQRVVRRDGWVYTYDQTGKVISKRRAA